MPSRLKQRTGSSREIRKSGQSMGQRRSGYFAQPLKSESMESLRFQTESEALQSAHHQLETALGRYFDLYQLAPSGCLILDKDGVVLDSSLHPAAIFGWNGWRGRNFRFAMAVEDQTAFNLAHTLLDGSGWPQICEIRLYREQVEFWAQLELLPGQHGLTVVFLVDITARKLAESRLEERQRQMLEFLGEQT